MLMSRGLILLICQHRQKVVIPSRLFLPALGTLLTSSSLRQLLQFSASEISVPFSCVIESWRLTRLAYYIKSLQEELTRQEAVLAREDLEAQHLCREKSCYYYLKCMIFPRSAQI